MQSKYQTLTEVRQALVDYEEKTQPKDLFATLNQFRIDAKPDSLSLVRFNDPTQNFRMMDWAKGQLFSKLGYSDRLYEKLAPSKLNELNLNWLAQNIEADKEIMLRTVCGTHARALLSNRYEPYASSTLVDETMPYFPPDAKVRGSFCDPTVFHCSITLPSTTTEIVKGDVVEAGIHLSNSEVGFRSVTVCGFIYRLVCTNGLIAGERTSTYRFRHVGNGDNFHSRVKSSIESALLSTTDLLEKLRKSVNEFIEKPADELARIVKQNNLSQDDYKEILNRMTSNQYGDDMNTKYGLVNAITQYANAFSGERAYEIQQVASNIL
jgi:hypothetical protein